MHGAPDRFRKQGARMPDEQTNSLLNRIEAQASHGIFDVCDDFQVYQLEADANEEEQAPF